MHQERLINVKLTKKTKSKSVKSKTWYLLWYETNPETGTRRQRRKSTGTNRETAAKKIAAEFESILRKEREIRDMGHDPELERRLRRTPFSVVVEEFLADLKDRRADSTFRDYKTALDLFVADCDPAKVASVNGRMIRKFKHARHSNVSKVTVDKYLRVVRAFLNWAKKDGFVDSIPVFEMYNQEMPVPVSVPRENLQHLINKLRTGEIKLRFLSAEWWELCIRFLHYSGLRRSECLLLKWSAVDLQAKQMVIHRETSKKNRTSTVVLSDDIVHRLSEWKQKCQSGSMDGFVFPRAIAIRTVCEEFESIRDQAGMPDLKMKHLRSTCATELAQKCPLSVVQNHLRHASPTTTAGYYVNGGPALRQAAKMHEPL